MKLIYAIALTLIMAFSVNCFAEDWYEAEEKTACDYVGSASSVVRDDASGEAYASRDMVTKDDLRKMRIEQENSRSSVTTASGSNDVAAATSAADARPVVAAGLAVKAQ